jgi:hypothetical protein
MYHQMYVKSNAPLTNPFKDGDVVLYLVPVHQDGKWVRLEVQAVVNEVRPNGTIVLRYDCPITGHKGVMTQTYYAEVKPFPI